jgi:uncharacterized protein
MTNKKTPYEKYLYLAKSTLPGAGKGLFTKVSIRKGEKIVEYKGKIITWKQHEKLSDEGKGGYAFFVNNNYVIDAYHTPQYLARYANDARGLSRVEGIRNNSVYEEKKKIVHIVATRNIPAGSEIFCSYGDEYWDAIKDKLKKKDKARKAEQEDKKSLRKKRTSRKPTVKKKKKATRKKSSSKKK